MKFVYHIRNNKKIAEIESESLRIKDDGDLIEVVANTDTNIIIIRKQMLDPSFFDLRSGIAGEIMQKISNYNIRLGVVGDYTNLTSKSLKAFITECNRVNHVIFVKSVDEALQRFFSS
jgi:hypothetical protein